MAIAMLSIPAMSRGDANMPGREEGDTIVETDGTSIVSPEAADSNYNILNIGNDKSLAFGPGIDPIAANNLEIKENQDSGDCECCKSSYKRIPFNLASIKQNMQNMQDSQKNALEISTCQDCCIKMNIDRIKAGDRAAIAFGFSEATNSQKIAADQE